MVILKFLCIEGFLISQSTNKTFASPSAKVNAKLPEVVDLPSPGFELVTTIVLYSLSKEEYWILVFLLEYLDNTYKNKDQLEKDLGIPVLGAIPDVDMV